MDLTAIAVFVGGLTLLFVGAEWLVRGASQLARAAGISPLVVGLTVVAYGTGAPELAVSVQSSLLGEPDLALGNIVGSNISNVLLVLGLSALMAPLLVTRQLVWLHVPVMIGVSCLLFFIALDGRLSRLDGAVLCAGALTYTLWLIVQERKDRISREKERDRVCNAMSSSAHRVWLLNTTLLIVGLVFLVLGARFLVDSAVIVATAFGLSELVVGLTVVAVGTSLPEIATSLVASIRGERDLVVGTVVGSNIFNILVVLGLTSVIAPYGIDVAPAALRFDVLVMIVVAIACLPIFFTGHKIARWEGTLFVGYYAAYTCYLLFDALQHDLLPAFSSIMLTFVIPLTMVTLLVFIARHVWAAQERSE